MTVIYFILFELEFIWTLFKIYDNDVFYFILFEFMIKYLFFKYFCKHLRVFVDIRRYEKNRRIPA